MKKSLSIIIAVIFFITAVVPFGQGSVTHATETGDRIQILFTHDLHSHLDPFDVEGEESGGFARLKTLIDDKRYDAETQGIATLLLDGGDFSMGTLYQTIFEKEAPELTLLGYMGYDAATFGNHEFDYRSIGVSNMLNAAISNEETIAPSERFLPGNSDQVSETRSDYSISRAFLPEIVISNIDWEINTSDDNLLVKSALEKYGAKEYVIIEKNGIKAGIFGLMGDDAEACAPESGIDFGEITEAAKETVAKIKEEGADLIICLSHSGVWDDETKSEDEILAKAVPEIDLIVSGHTHTRLDVPITHGDTHIAATQEYGKFLGEIDLVRAETGRWEVENYKINPIDASIGEDPFIKSKVDEYKAMINTEYLAQFGYEYDTFLAVNNVGFTPIAQFGKVHEEDTLGSIIADSYIYAVKQAEGESYETVYATVAPNGTIRDTFPKGDITVWEVFNVASLGIGPDRIVGYPLVSVYLTGAELKTIAEVDVSVTALMSAAQLYPSGIRWDYNPNRLILNKVTNVELVDENGQAQPIEDDRLYRSICGLYSAQMLGSVTDLSYGLLSVTPKDKDGNPITNYEDHIVYDQNGNELKEWYALASYFESFPVNEDGVPEVPDTYAQPEGRKLADDDSSIGAILKAPNKIMKMIYAVIVAVVVVIVLIIYGIVCIIRRRKRAKGRA